MRAIWSRLPLASLTAIDARVVGEAQERVGVDVRAGACRYVVDDDRQVALVGDGAEMRLEHPAVRAVVVRGNHQRRISAELGRPSRGRDRRCRVVRAGAGDDAHAVARRPLVDDLHGGLDQPFTFGRGQGR